MPVEVYSSEQSELRRDLPAKDLSTFEKYLPLWIAVCMVFGVILSLVVPGISEAIDS